MKTKFKVTMVIEVDRDVYPLPVSDEDHDTDIEEAVKDTLYEIDGFEVKKIRAAKQ